MLEDALLKVGESVETNPSLNSGQYISLDELLIDEESIPIFPYMSSGQWSRLRLPPTTGGIACHSSPMGRCVSMVVVDKTPRLGRALFAAISRSLSDLEGTVASA